MPANATTYRYPRRQAPPLPPAESMPFPGNLVRQCSDCDLIDSCKNPVPGEGQTPAKVLLVGEAPGANEDEWGKPFVGQAGQQLDSLLFQIGLSRGSIYITNTIHCRPPNNRDPKPPETKACAKWLEIELSLVDPDIVVAMGAPAIRWFLGQGCGTVEHLHGKPIEIEIGSRTRILLPCYHPAAALHNTTLLRQCQEDFQVLQGLVKGVPLSEYNITDEYPNPDYRVADTPVMLQSMMSDIRESGEVAVDTEICNGKLWSVQFSARPGTSWFVPIKDDFRGRVDLTGYNALTIVHYYLFDIRWLILPDNRVLDTMAQAYLLGFPQGLKELASRLCGINMASYSEIVRPGQRKMSLEYLTEASRQEWADPPEIEETKWNNKQGMIVTRIKKPWHISRKVARILADTMDNIDVDPYKRWRDIPELERAEVESNLGAMAESSLADIKFEDSVQYSCRDSDATIRVKHKMDKLISQLGLDYTLKMDMDILPMVDEMMRTGMAVDLDHFRNLSVEYDARMRAKSAELASIVGHSFNPNSSQQVAQVIYSELDFKPTRLTPTKEISTDDQELKKTGHPVAKGVIEYRRLSKVKGTYADALVDWAIPDKDGIPRIHSTIKTTRTETGRLASADPNLQNQPTRSKEGKVIREGFIVPPGWLMCEGDFGQIEMCTQAHLARCKELIALFLRGDDPHTVTASKIFDIPYDDAKQEKYRYPTKRANFGIIYMIGAQGLSNQIQEYIADLEMEGSPVEIEPWDEITCQRFIDDWYQLYPEVKDYQLEQASMARRYGYVRDMFGRIRYIPEVSCPVRSIQEAGLRMAANMPVQCLPASTRVLTRSGWIAIGDFVSGEVWTGEEWATACRVTKEVNKRVSLLLSDGRTFDCDENHHLLVSRGPWPEWMNVMDIKDEDSVPLVLDWHTDWGDPVGEVEDWYWAGRFIGDGWISGPSAKIKAWGISFGSREWQAGERLTVWLDKKKVRGVTNSRKGYTFDFDQRSNFKVRGGTKAGYALWESLGMQRVRAKEKRIPTIIFTLDYPRREAFLRGYTDADGRTSNRDWVITSASRGLLEDVVRLAQTIGFSAKVNSPRERERHGVVQRWWNCTVLKVRREVTVTGVEVLPAEQMYTLSVDNPRHAFSTEGLISKNSSAQGILKLAMGKLWRDLPKTGWRESVRFLMQIHDSLLLEIREEEEIWKPYLDWMEEVMCGVVKLLVPVRVDFKIGKNWKDLEKYEKEN